MATMVTIDTQQTKRVVSYILILNYSNPLSHSSDSKAGPSLRRQAGVTGQRSAINDCKRGYFQKSDGD